MITHDERGQWTSEARTQIGQLWNDGHSASEIAGQMHASRNAVIGVIHRMGLSGRCPPGTPEFARRLSRANARFFGAPMKPPKPLPEHRQLPPPCVVKPVVVRAKPVVNKPGAVKVKAVIKPESKPIVQTMQPRSWMTRKLGECAFPVEVEGELLSCCNVTDTDRNGAHLHYCAAHCLVMYVQAPLKKIKAP